MSTQTEMSLICGIDIGSTSVKISLFDTNVKTIKATNKIKYNFPVDQTLTHFPNYCQQNVGIIVNCIQKTLLNFDISLRTKIKMISICGQMHGCVLWDNQSYYEYTAKSCELKVSQTNGVSDLYNWQDSRCDHQFIASLPTPDSYATRVSSGFGCATIFWINKHSPQLLSQFNSGGTVMDFIVAVLCGLKRPVMSTQNAMSWGYFDPIVHSWNEYILKANDFPIHLLPIVKKSGSVAGETQFNWLGIEAKTPVLVALGDMQCATYANLRDNPNNAVLSISTSMQMSVLMDKSFTPVKSKTISNSSIDYFPYFDDSYLSVAASLNGGNVLQHLVQFVRNTIKDMADIELSDEQIWAKIFQLHDTVPKVSLNNELIVKPTLFGERHNTRLKGSVVNISNSITLSQIFESFCEGLIDNIFEMMSIEYIMKAGVKRVIGTGSGLFNNQIMRDIVERKLNIPVIYIDGNDADVGAVWVAFDHCFSMITQS